ncbi:MAG: DUF5671 domain-containing protein [Candidatus Dormibacter sp.]
MILRRLYLYLVSIAALGLLVAGISLLGTTVLLFVFNDPTAQDSRTTLAGFTAMTLVAAPVWAVHFWFARRYAMRDRLERASALRRLYLYLACLALAVGSIIALAWTLGDLLRPLLDTCAIPHGPFIQKVLDPNCPAVPHWLTTTQTAWVTLVLLGFWALHFRIAASDRAAVGEEGASATLRRWYMYPALLVGVLTMLSGASTAIAVGILHLLNNPAGDYQYMGDALGEAIAGAALWGFHVRTVALHHITDDRHSTLRALEGFIAVAVSIATALFGASQILYYLLARALVVNNPGGVNNDILAGLAVPGSWLIVYGVAWFLLSRRLARDAGTQEADRQAGIRRLYTNLACLVSLAALAVGAGGLLWTLAEQLEAPLIGVAASDWKDAVSKWVTLLVVGSAVWVAYWRPSPWAADRQSLSRRLYVWAALLGSVLVALGAGVGVVYALLNQLFSAHPRLNDPTNLDFGHYLAVIVVAVVVGMYHWRVLRADATARPGLPAMRGAPARSAGEGAERAAAPPATTAAAPSTPRPAEVPDSRSRRYLLSVTDATDDDVHQALSNLPPQAGYKLTSAERAD